MAIVEPPARHRALFDELTALAGCFAGDWPGGVRLELDDAAETWSFRVLEGVIQADLGSFDAHEPDALRAFLLHEAAHACQTLTVAFAPLTELRAAMPLHQVLEDARIEAWLRARLPGAAPWIDRMNAKIVAGWDPAEIAAQPLPGAFLSALAARLIFGVDVPGLPARVSLALERVAPHARAFRDLHPEAPGFAAAAVARWPKVLGARAWRPEVTWGTVPARVAAVLSWDLMQARIAPELDALCREAGLRPGSCEADEALRAALGLLGLALQELERLLEAATCGQAGAGLRPEQRGVRARGPGGRGGRRAARRARTPGRSWEACLAAVEPTCEALGEALLQAWVPRLRGGWSRGFASGPRVNLRRAMQAEADPRLLQGAWLRRRASDRPDPAIALVVDTSGSMAGPKTEAAIGAAVVLVETCLRLGIPVAVWAFDSTTQELHPPDRPFDRAAGDALVARFRACEGGTDLAGALRRVRETLAAWPQREQHVIVLTDGEPHDEDAVRRELARCRAADLGVVGLGLGPGTEAVARLFPAGRGGLRVHELPEVMGELVRGVVVGANAQG